MNRNVLLFCLGVLGGVGLLFSALHAPVAAWADERPPATERSGEEPGARGDPAPREPTGILTLRYVLSLALKRNPELKAFWREVRALEARRIQAGFFPNPEVEIEVENFGGQEDLEGFDAAETTIRLSQLIELAGKRSKRRQVASLERELARWDYETRRADVLTEATRAFVDVLAAQERLALMEELVSLSGQVLQTVSERVKAGKVSPLEETKAKVSYASSLIDLERARHALDASRKKLAALWGSGRPLFERVEGDLEKIRPLPPAEELERLIPQNPDIARWAVERKQRREALQLEEAGKIPDLTLSGGFRRFKEIDDSAFVMGLSIPLPLFDRNQGGIREAGERLAKAWEEERVARLTVLDALAEAYQELSVAYAEAQTLQRDVLPGARAAFDAASEGYRQGKFGYLDVLDAQRTLFEARGRYIEVLASYHKSAAKVERLIGIGLDAVSTHSSREG